ncbi:MarR family winged helix-turn-helix transcriptional regulator [Azospirillum thermophilum]|uniref:MarR family transcriptional regulator n=1 Tax=Azospirillum thermophilum TaxID=2202148 RepID=A0A2S2D0V5_9PROT|nr:MarR family transcriptional regulator [Azospirillum thermophilum]AWK90097.1 MarR family transcriptional regulator [Azospirillum thermophilum]
MQSAATPAVYTDLGRIMESITRRFLDVLRMELARVGVTDLSPTQALMLLHIGGEELSVRDLLERGYYLGSNASYNLKHLTEAGYVDRSASQRDRRTARLRLSERGLAVCEALKRLEALRAGALVRSESDAAEVETTYRTLRRLERAWMDLIRYDDDPPSDPSLLVGPAAGSGAAMDS